MTGSNTEAAALKRRRARKMRKQLGNWLLGVTVVLVVVGFVGALIVLPIMSHFDDIEAKKREQADIDYKIYHRRF